MLGFFKSWAVVKPFTKGRKLEFTSMVGATNMRVTNCRIGQVMGVTCDRTATDLRAHEPRMSFVSLSARNCGPDILNQKATAMINLRPIPTNLRYLPTDLQPTYDLGATVPSSRVLWRPTYELKYRLETHLRPYPEFARVCHRVGSDWGIWAWAVPRCVVNLKPDWNLWSWPMLLPFNHMSALLYLYFLTLKSLVCGLYM